MTSGVYQRTEKTREKMSESKKGNKGYWYGKSRSEETKNKISLTKKGVRPPPFSKEHKMNISKGKQGLKQSEEHRKNNSNAQKGKKLSKEHKRKISLANKGRKVSIETKKKISILKKGNKYRLGKKHTEESKKKMRMVQKGKKISKEYRKKISLSMKGNINMLGKNHSEESKKKMSSTKQGINIKNWEKYISFKPYNKFFDCKFKRFIRKRDNNVCMLCGKKKEDEERDLCVHHIDYNKLNSTPYNCISLCKSCHGRTCVKRKYWIKFFQALLKEKYGYEY
ncbi:MAG TPA: NUMOD3 domain-containing DNA-binding protein [Bacillota bacterium]|nr:NUMOD3 domain-containing DNA-binding protein [Bacillota bacterium]